MAYPDRYRHTRYVREDDAAPLGEAAASSLSFLDALLLDMESRKFDWAARSEERRLQARRRRAEEQLATEQAEADRDLRRLRRYMGIDFRQMVLGCQIEEERLLLELDRVRRERLEVASLPLPDPREAAGGPPRGQLPAGPAVQPEIGDAEIEKLALQAFRRLESLPPGEADQARAAWSDDLRKRLGEWAADEVDHRLREFKELAG